MDSRERHYIVAKALADGSSITDAMIQAGYSQSVARMGRSKIPKAVYALYFEMTGRELRTIGEAMCNNPKMAEHLLVGSLTKSMIERNSKGVNAARALTHHISVAEKFTPEQQNNVVVIQAPADWKPPTKEYKDWESLPPVAQQALPEYE